MLLAACGKDHRPGSQSGQPDQPQTKSLRVNEAALTASLEGQRLRLQIPLASTDAGPIAGQLAVSVTTVDGSRSLASRRVEYALEPGQTGIVTAELPLPPDLAGLADWVSYNVRVEREGARDLRVTRSLLSLVAPYEVRLEGPTTVTRGRRTRYRVRTQDPVTFRMLTGVPVELLVRQGDKVAAQYQGITGDKGDASFELTLDLEGEVKVEARASAQATSADVAGTVTVERPGAKVLLTTDKPIYQPGQTIHLRALALDRTTQVPVTGKPVLFEIDDGKGNKIFKRNLESDQHGVAAARFKLGAVLNMGTFKVRVSVGPDRSEKTVEVSRYVLPKFKVAVDADRPYYAPGEAVTGLIDARYFFGKPVASAEVTIEAATLDIGATVFQRVIGVTDASGKFAYSLTLPSALVGLPLQQGSALVSLRVQVTDGAGQKVQQERAITVAARPIRLALIPEATVVVPGLENRLDLFVTDPLGEPIAEASVELGGPGITLRGSTDAHGHAAFTVTPPSAAPGAAGDLKLQVKASTKQGLVVSEDFSLAAQAGAAQVLVRTDRAVYALGETVQVEVRTSGDRSAVYVDWNNNGQTVDMRTLDVKDGVARFQAAIDTGLLGASRIEAYLVGPDGNLIRAGRTIFARGRGALSVELSSDQPQYTPGQPAELTFTVKDEAGVPAVAALGVQMVDEAVFALVDARPGLLKTYFELEGKLAEPHYQIRAPAGDLTKLLLEETSAADPAAAGAAQTRAAATLAALGGGAMMGLARGSWQELAGAVSTRLAPHFEATRKALIPTVAVAAQAALRRVKAQGCRPEDYYCAKLAKSFTVAVQEELARLLTVWDFWGNEYRKDVGGGALLRLVSSGPDEKADSNDDRDLVFQASELGLPDSVRGELDGSKGVPGGGGVVGGPGGAPQPQPGALPGINDPMSPAPPGAGGASGSDSGNPRVRKEFPETLYVNPQLITGPDGKAKISVPLADSITEWRVSSLAHTAGGKLGGGLGAIRVFQEFFVDIDFPATLTRGDEVDFPVAVYNYLDTPQSVRVDLEPAAWYAPRGVTSHSLLLAPGQVTGVRFPVRVLEVGRQTLTVKGTGGQRSDAVARVVLVQPDGKAVPSAQSGSLSPGAVSHSVTFPVGAVPGSARLHLDVFPAFLAQAVTGMDSMLAVPNGCFEQTTSTAWPNVLVTDYLKQTGQLKPEVALKAESLMSAGYQRLLTFEHKGGGFSWFGEQDPAPYLSVTAFGLMEFADMAKVHPVDEAMIERTRRWLLSKQNQDGSWKGDMSEFFSFHKSLVRNTAFVVWSLASAGYKGAELERGLQFVKQQLDKEKLDAYSLAMVANAFLTAAPGDPFAGQVLDQLDALKKGEGTGGDKVSWDSGADQTSFYGSGNDAKVTTTALVAHALLLAGRDKPTVDRALAFLTGARDAGGNFGSTQATIWTLRTLLLASRKGTEGAVGAFTVEVDGQPFTTLMLTADQSEVMTTVDLASVASIGTRQVTLRFAGTGKPSYNLVAQHHLPWDALPGGQAGPLSVSVTYDKTRLVMDDTATARVVVRNNTGKVQDMVMVTVGLPPGFEVLSEDLDRYKADRKLSRYDITGKQLILYVSSLPATTAQTFAYRLRAVMPVKAADGGAEAYLYYQPDTRAAAAGTTLEVVAAGL